MKSGMCVWITGLPGCGKSAVSREFCQLGRRRGMNFLHLEMDALRKNMIHDPQYTDRERGRAYRMLAFMAEILVKMGNNVVIDATGHRREWRELARKRIPGFLEIFIDTPISLCIEREDKRGKGKVMSNLYRKALERKRTGKNIPGLGEVIGVDVQYERSDNPQLVIEPGERDELTLAEEIWSKLAI